MDVLIIEGDELVRSVLAAMLDAEGISATGASDEEALKLLSNDAPQVVITGINRGHDEGLTGLEVVAAPRLCAVYLAALWPARLRREMLADGERFLTKPMSLPGMIRTVRKLLDSDLCRSQKPDRGEPPPG